MCQTRARLNPQTFKIGNHIVFRFSGTYTYQSSHGHSSAPAHLKNLCVRFSLKICMCGCSQIWVYVTKQGLVFSFQKALHNNSLPIYQDRIHNCVRALKSLWYLSKCMLLFASYSWLNSNVNWDQKFVETTEVFCQFLTPRCASKVSSHGPITYKLLMHSAL